MSPLRSGASLVVAATATENALRDKTAVPKTDTKVNEVQNAQRRMPAARDRFILWRIVDFFVKESLSLSFLSYSPGGGKKREKECIHHKGKKKREKDREGQRSIKEREREHHFCLMHSIRTVPPQRGERRLFLRKKYEKASVVLYSVRLSHALHPFDRGASFEKK